MSVPHPYYPTNLTLPGYTPNTHSATELIGAWLVALSTLTVATFAWLAPKNKLTLTERLITLWFITCGFIHIVFEGTLYDLLVELGKCNLFDRTLRIKPQHTRLSY
ncbi:hypothetical protein D9756_007422 [Leucocoprinus leucothites]|uniref:Uncharacterized protein n=1 Tax=Leucocoprinus leucothites TaxID=201217 RepID=A0A8H5D302_9AGAR|nr:hypothetical protein D9756_007422 [Leucoagaricus leucothites]